MRPTASLLLLALALLAGCGRPTVLVLGLDGAAWNVMDPLMQAGQLPALAAVVERGVRADYDCAPALPALACFCPPVWTSLFTGHLYERHGIVFDDQPASERGVKAVWSVLRDHGGSSSSVSMHNQLPIDTDFDLVLSQVGVDHAASEIHERWPTGLPLEAFVPELRSRPQGLFELLGLLPHGGPRPPVWAPIARDRTGMQGLVRMLRRWRTDLTVIHLHSPDKVGHASWASLQASPGAPLREQVLLDAAQAWDAPHEAPGPFGWGPVAAPYVEIDRWLGALLDEMHFDYIVLLSDHGMERRAGPGLAGDHGPTANAAHRGILAIRGPQLRAGVDLGTVGIGDVAPTLAYLLDLPVGDDLPGRVIEEAFVPGRLAARPIARVPSWESPPHPEERSEPELRPGG